MNVSSFHSKPQHQTIKRILDSQFYSEANTVVNQQGIAFQPSKVILTPSALQPYHPLFRKLSVEGLHYLFQKCGELVRLKPQQYLYLENEPSTCTYIIIYGRINMSCSKRGGFGAVSTGETLGEEALVADREAFRLETA